MRPSLGGTSHPIHGVGEAFFTKWFAFAGFVPGRDWQPLILDSRVRATLHQTLDVWLNQLTDNVQRLVRLRALCPACNRFAERHSRDWIGTAATTRRRHGGSAGGTPVYDDGGPAHRKAFGAKLGDLGMVLTDRSKLDL